MTVNVCEDRVIENDEEFYLVLGVPGRIAGWMSAHGERLPPFDAQGRAVCPATGEVYRRTATGIERVG